ncbi:hypothetical protein B0H14DRAFT_1340243 [Mycena olivaceomarginata]|nr:hypothetical protein B0H14DRAFT_1340243 [Mycena olivaceomarginata]
MDWTPPFRLSLLHPCQPLRPDAPPHAELQASVRCLTYPLEAALSFRSHQRDTLFLLPLRPCLPPHPDARTFDSPQAGQPTSTTVASGAHAIFNHPALNSSAPALTTGLGFSATTTPVPRAAAAPAKKHLAFASNLSVYDTFNASMYDRQRAGDVEPIDARAGAEDQGGAEQLQDGGGGGACGESDTASVVFPCYRPALTMICITQFFV